MITNDQELRITQERITRFQRWLAQIRQNARPEEFSAAAGAYRLEIERMQSEALDYLLQPRSSPAESQPA